MAPPLKEYPVAKLVSMLGGRKPSGRGVTVSSVAVSQLIDIVGCVDDDVDDDD